MSLFICTSFQEGCIPYDAVERGQEGYKVRKGFTISLWKKGTQLQNSFGLSRIKIVSIIQFSSSQRTVEGNIISAKKEPSQAAVSKTLEKVRGFPCN